MPHHSKMKMLWTKSRAILQAETHQEAIPAVTITWICARVWTPTQTQTSSKSKPSPSEIKSTAWYNNANPLKPKVNIKTRSTRLNASRMSCATNNSQIRWVLSKVSRIMMRKWWRRYLPMSQRRKLNIWRKGKMWPRNIDMAHWTRRINNQNMSRRPLLRRDRNWAWGGEEDRG